LRRSINDLSSIFSSRMSLPSSRTRRSAKSKPQSRARQRAVLGGTGGSACLIQ
jgi:hypothetical protein